MKNRFLTKCVGYEKSDFVGVLAAGIGRLCRGWRVPRGGGDFPRSCPGRRAGAVVVHPVPLPPDPASDRRFVVGRGGGKGGQKRRKVLPKRPKRPAFCVRCAGTFPRADRRARRRAGRIRPLLDFDVDDRQVVILDYQRLHFYSLDGEYEKTVHMADKGTYVRLLSGGGSCWPRTPRKGWFVCWSATGRTVGILSKEGNGIISEKDLLSFRRERRSFFRMACVRTMCGALGEKKFSPALGGR